MTIEEALNILNLNKNYTEEELKKTYRTLIIKYHPDKNPENKKQYAENKSKQINEAKDILEKNLKNKNTSNNNRPNYHTYRNQSNSNQTYNNLEFLNLLKKARNFVIEEYNTINSIDSNDKIFMKHKYNLADILDRFLAILTIINNEYDLKKEYQSFFDKYNIELQRYYIDFSNSVYTGEDNNMWTIHYCDTLKQIRDIMMSSIDYELQNEITKYSNHKYYQDILPLLNKMKNDLTSICMYGYCKIEIIKYMFNTIISKEFKEYEERKEIVKTINVNIPTYIKMRYLSFKRDILDGDNFYKAYTRLEKINKVKSKIRKIFKKH